jgi:coenzyme F420-reducing hydrogenase delta subunit
VAHVQDVLKNIGLEPERVQMFNLSSAMAGQFAEATKEMTEKVEALGSNPLRRKVKSEKQQVMSNE